MFVVSLVASQALAADWSSSGITGAPNMVAGFDFLGRPVSMDPLPYTSGLIQSLVPAAVSTAVQSQVPPLVNSAIQQQVPGLASTAIQGQVPPLVNNAIQQQVPALVNNAILQQVPAMCMDNSETLSLIEGRLSSRVPELSIDGGEVLSLIDNALLEEVPGICDDRIDLRVPAMIESAIVARVPALSLDATEGTALVDAAILAQVPGIVLAEIGATVPDLVDDAILEQVPALCVDEIDARVPGAIQAAILAQVPGMSLDAAEASALVDAAILAQVPAMSLDAAEALALVDAAILAQVPDICLDAIDAVVPDLIDAAILDQVPGIAQDEIEATVPDLIDALSPPSTGLSFGSDNRVAWTQIGSGAPVTGGNSPNRVVFNLHVEETAARTYDEIAAIVVSGSANNLLLALYALDDTGVPGELLWSGPPLSGATIGQKTARFSDGTWTVAGADFQTPAGDLELAHGDEVLLAEQTTGSVNLRAFNISAVRALGASASTGQAFTGWELVIPTAGQWPESGLAAVGRTASPPVMTLRVKP